jgi:hypothetical protein
MLLERMRHDPELAAQPRSRNRDMIVMGWALAVVPPLTYLAYMALNAPGRWLRFVDDDAYYYLGVARHIVAGDGSTFGGVMQTNGYQPLWMVVLLPVASVFRGATPLVVATIVLQSLIWIAVVWEALRIGRRFGGEVCAVGGVAVLGVLAFGARHLSFDGMESALLLLLLLIALRLIFEAGDQQDLRADLRLGLVFALICLTRFDAGATALALAIVALTQTRASPSPLARRILALGAPAGLALLGYAALNLALFGIALPVSGQAKSVGGPFFSRRVIRQALDIEVLGRSTWLGAVTLGLVVVAVAVARSRSNPGHARLVRLMAALLVGQAALVGYIFIFTSYGMLSWYHYNTALLLFLASLVIIDAAARSRGALVRPGVILLALAVLGVQAAGTFLARAHSQDGAVTGAEFVNAHLPEDAVLAMSDRAGQFGYYSDRKLLHIEGLTGDAKFVDEMADGTVLDRMVSEGVDYYILYGGEEKLVPIAQGCWKMGEPRVRDRPLFSVVICDSDLVYRRRDSDGVPFSIWRFRPELQRPGQLAA